MDNVTASVVSIGETAPSNPSASGIKKPGKSFRVLFLLLLIATLISAIATSYILMNRTSIPQPTVVVTTPLPQTENPFSENTVAVNPFDETATESSSVNPFAETNSANPFDQFETETSSTINTAENPF